MAMSFFGITDVIIFIDGSGMEDGSGAVSFSVNPIVELVRLLAKMMTIFQAELFKCVPAFGERY